jgi:hypothetical protein
MILCFPVKLKSLFEKGRRYPWPRPEKCPRCSGCTVWGHGYAGCFFDGFSVPLLLKRYLCCDCGCVMRCRPAGYFRRFQASIETIRSSISIKMVEGRWLRGLSRTRQGHWWRALKRRIAAYLGNTWKRGVLAGFDHLLALSQVPVGRSI